MPSHLAGRPINAQRSFPPVPKLVRRSFLLFIFTIPFEGLEIPFVTSGVFTITKICGLVFFASYLFHLNVPTKKPGLRIPRAMGCFLIYFALYAGSGLLASEDGLRSYIGRLITLTQLIVFFWAATDLLSREKLAKSSLVSFATACALVATGNLLGLPGFSTGAAARASALGANPNFVAVLMAYAGVVLIGFCLIDAGWSRKQKYFFLALALPVLAMMISTASRSGIGAFVIGLSLFFFPYHGSRVKIAAFFFALIMLMGVVYWTALDPRASKRWGQTIEEGNVSGRLEIFEVAVEMIAERPLFGWGPSTANRELGLRLGMANRTAHNMVLHLFIEVGIAGGLPFLIGLGLCALAGWRARRGTLGLLPLAIFTTFLAYSVTSTAISHKTTWYFMALPVAAFAAVSKMRRSRIVLKAHGPVDVIEKPDFQPRRAIALRARRRHSS